MAENRNKLKKSTPNQAFDVSIGWIKKLGYENRLKIKSMIAPETHWAAKISSS